MKDAEHILESLGEGIGYIEVYVHRRLEMLKLDVAEKSSLVISSVITTIVLVVLGLLTLLFASITLGLFLGSWLDSYGWGFAIVTGIYILVLLAVYFLRRRLVTNPVVSMVISGFFKKKENNEDHVGEN